MAKITTATLAKMKAANEKIAAITAYDASFAKLFDDLGMHVILIGDSLGMVLQGHDSTIPVNVDDICYHTQCVARGAASTLIIADMPFMSYANAEQTYANAAKLMQAGATMVKLEGGEWLYDTIAGLVTRGIPVCGHLGLTPQSVHAFGGFKIQGRDADKAKEMIEHAQGLEKAGAQLLVLECIPASLAKAITEAVKIPVIGIGAGRDTDGQILVMHDIFGISAGYIPKFSKNYLAETGDIRKAVSQYMQDVASGAFPDDEHIFN